MTPQRGRTAGGMATTTGAPGKDDGEDDGEDDGDVEAPAVMATDC
jgi:hypothetical protein